MGALPYLDIGYFFKVYYNHISCSFITQTKAVALIWILS